MGFAMMLPMFLNVILMMVIVVLEKIPNVWVSRSPLFRKKRLMLDEKFQVVKCFKMCHILYIRKPQVTYSIFHFTLLYFSPNECPGLSRHMPNSPGLLTDDWKVTDNSSINFRDVFFFIFCFNLAKKEEKHVIEIYG